MSLLHSFVTPAPCRLWKMAPAVVPLSGTDLVTYCDAKCPRLAFSKHSSSTASSLSSSTHVTSRRGILKRSRPEKSVPMSRQAVADMGLAAEERPVEQQSSAGAQEESWSVHKFGSSCVASAEMILRVSDIILDDASLRKIVLVSAISEANDMIRDMLEKAQSQDYTYVDCLEEIRLKHASAAMSLLETGKDLDDFLNVLKEDVLNLSTLLRMVYIDGHATKAASDFVAGYGDAWSAQMLAPAVRKRGLSCVWLDSRKVFSTSPTSSNETDSIETDREFKFSLERLSSWYAESETDTIIASGLGSTYPDDLQISLKLEGNDFAAAIEGALFSTHSASWSDVKNASNTSLRKAIAGQNSSSISYQEALNMGQRMIRSQDVKDESASFGYKSEDKDRLRSSYGDEFPNQAESVTGATTIQAEFKALPDLDYLEELLAIQQSGPKAIGFFGTRNMGFMHQQLIEILSYAMVITKNHIFTSGASGTNAAVIRGALRAERPDLLTVILPQSLKRQPPESQDLLSKVKNVIEMPHNDLLPLLEASRLCNMDILSHVQQVICFAFHDSNLLMETCREAKNLRKIVTLFYLD